MKRILVFVVFLALGAMIIPWLSREGAADPQMDVYENQKFIKSVVFVVDWDEYYIDGKVPGIKMDAKPFIENERIYVPVRFLGNALGVSDDNIKWDNANQKATLKRQNDVLEMIVGVPQAIINGQAEDIDVAPVLKPDPSWRTYLPARFVAEGLGYQLEWDPASQTVMCWPKDQPKPDVAAVKQYVEQEKQNRANPPAQPATPPENQQPQQPQQDGRQSQPEQTPAQDSGQQPGQTETQEPESQQQSPPVQSDGTNFDPRLHDASGFTHTVQEGF